MQEVLFLRPLDALSLDIAADLHRLAFTPLGERPWSRQELAELLASPGVQGLLLQLGAKEVGFALCRVAADEAELLTLAVDPAHQRRGVGRSLLAAAIEHVAGAGARTLYLEVAVDNRGARALYDKAGFEESGRRATYYPREDGRTADALLMHFKLVG
jgi:ribosomal-protein-alanine N-acetyltransferase